VPPPPPPLAPPLEIRHKLQLSTYLFHTFLVLSASPDLSWFRFNFSVLNLCSSINFYKIHTSPTGLMASPDSTDGRRSLHCHLLPRAWHTRFIGAWMPWLLSPHLDSHWCFWALPANPAAERPPLGGACAPRTVREGSHPASIWTSAVFVPAFVISYLFLDLFVISPYSSLLLYLEPLDSVSTPNHLNLWP